jgi:signal peptidase I
MRRLAVPLVALVAVLAVAFFILDRTSLLVPLAMNGTSSEAPAIPACNGRALAEGFTYRFRDPKRGEMVAFHASGGIGGAVTPDADSRELAVVKRVIGIPGDQVVGRDGRAYVNGFKADDITTAGFKRVDLGSDEYFLLGDNRSSSQDSRDFGPVQRNAIFGRVFLVYWPLGDFGSPEPRHAGKPLGPGQCD